MGKSTANVSLISAAESQESEVRIHCTETTVEIDNPTVEKLPTSKTPDGSDLLARKRSFSADKSALVESVATASLVEIQLDSTSAIGRDSMLVQDSMLENTVHPTGDGLLARKRAFNDARSTQVETVAASLAAPVAAAIGKPEKEVPTEEAAPQPTWGDWANGDLEDDDSDEDFVPERHDGNAPAPTKRVTRNTVNENSSSNNNNKKGIPVQNRQATKPTQNGGKKKGKRKGKNNKSRNKANTQQPLGVRA
jgi:hypothetical protein